MIARIISGYDFISFVETGTSSGQSILAAAQSELFEYLYTVEINEGTIRDDLKPYMTDNIQFHIGDSVEFLKTIEPKYQVVYWLDAHYSGSEPAPEGVNECPLLQEIEAIFDKKDSECVFIVIDDARLFLGAPPDPHRSYWWPSLQDIIECINNHTKGLHTVTIVDDYIISYPLELQYNFMEYWKETYAERYP